MPPILAAALSLFGVLYLLRRDARQDGTVAAGPSESQYTTVDVT